jgi:hypothetical protein
VVSALSEQSRGARPPFFLFLASAGDAYRIDAETPREMAG